MNLAQNIFRFPSRLISFHEKKDHSFRNERMIFFRGVYPIENRITKGHGTKKFCTRIILETYPKNNSPLMARLELLNTNINISPKT
jgi:hypothetical protein